MADTLSTIARQRATPDADPVAIVRTFQSSVIRLRGVITALQFASDEEQERPAGQSLFWPDLMDALALLAPDADLLDRVVDALQRE